MKLYKTITLPDHGYNGSVLKLGDRLLFVYRHEPCLSRPPIYISACWLDLEYNIKSKSSLLTAGGVGYDPRLVMYNDKVLMYYTDHHRVHCTQVDVNKLCLLSDNILTTDMEQGQIEKNWLPFVSDDELFLIYSFNPHVILRQDLSRSYCYKEYSTETKYVWNHGKIFGGSTPIRFGNSYISFFHSWLASSPNHEKCPRVYYMGLYQYSDEPPYRVLTITKSPIWMNDFYSFISKSKHKVLFPTGVIDRGTDFHLTYGENDAATKILSVAKEEIASLLR